MKICKRCGETKPLDGFYRHSAMGDGYLSFCRECTKARVRDHRKNNLDRVQEYDRVRNDDPERVAARRARRLAAMRDEQLRARLYATQAKWAEQNKVKRQAHYKVGNAIRDGKLTVQPCERCGYGVGVHAHHEDYSKPLDVNWLCKKCHGQRHREINEERRKSA